MRLVSISVPTHMAKHSTPHLGWGGKGESALRLVGASWNLCVGAGGSEASPRRAPLMWVAQESSGE